MSDYTIKAMPRQIVGKKVKTLRKAGWVPATVYGPNTEPVSVKFPYRELQVMLMKAGGTHIIDIDVDGKKYPSLARDVQRDILKGDIMHVDFMAVDMNVKIRAEIPLSLDGESPVVAARQGILITGPNTLTVEMLPSRLMDHISVDLSVLKEVGDAISVADLHLDDVTIINDPEEMIAKVVVTSAMLAAESAESEEESATGSEPEVISRGKAEDED